MQPVLTATQLHLLRMIFDRGTEAASQALSKWLGHEIRLSMSSVDEVEVAQAVELLGPPESLVAACSMGLTGWLTGLILLVFRDRSGLALTDLLLHQGLGTSTTWGELEVSAAKETTNIVGCAYVNALASHLPSARRRRLLRGTRAAAREQGAQEAIWYRTPHTCDLRSRVCRQPARVRFPGAGSGAGPGSRVPIRSAGRSAGVRPRLDAALYTQPRVTARARCVAARARVARLATK